MSTLKLVFQSTLPREERLARKQSIFRHLHFNPRSHERIDGVSVDDMDVSVISIHAPTRGATILIAICLIEEGISIHAPTRGATAHHRWLLFQSSISIHAPTRGATPVAQDKGLRIVNFNPRSHERSDSNIAQKICLFLYNTDNKYIIR